MYSMGIAIESTQFYRMHDYSVIHENVDLSDIEVRDFSLSGKMEGKAT